MKAALQNVSLARWIIIFSLIASAGLGFYGYRLHTRRVELELALKSRVPELAMEIQKLAKQHSSLMKQYDREGLGDQKDPQTYIRTIAAGKDVMIGDTSVDAPVETEFIKGVLDTRYTVKPSSRDRGYPRLNIANFLYKLESESRRLRVTRLRMEPEAKSVKPETILENDSWRWEAEVTSRTKINTPAPAVKK